VQILPKVGKTISVDPEVLAVFLRSKPKYFNFSRWVEEKMTAELKDVIVVD